MGVTQSVLFYSAEVWTDKEAHRKRLAEVQRREVSRVPSSYRTVSELAGGKARSPDCVFCNGVADDTKPTFFSCERWDGFRQQLYVDTLSADNIVREMLKSTGSWNRVAHYVRALLIAKKIELDRRRDRMVSGSLN